MRARFLTGNASQELLALIHIDGNWLLESESKRSLGPEVDVPLTSEVGDGSAGTGASFTADWCEIVITTTAGGLACAVRAWPAGAFAYAADTDASISVRTTAIPAAAANRTEPARRLPER